MPEEAEITVPWEDAGWVLPDFTGRGMRDVMVGLQGSGLHVAVQGSGVAVSQEPAAGTRVQPGHAVTVVFD